MLLSTAYLPPISWFAAIAKDFTLSPDRVIASVVYIEANENYQKQTYRNRCKIYGANGVEILNVPVVHENGTFKLPIRKIKIDYSTPWVVRTKRAIASAYESSAFFEYYKDDIFSVFDSMPETLWDLNMSLIQVIMKKLGIETEYRLTEDFITAEKAVESPYYPDYRTYIHPKKENTLLKDMKLEKPYFQVFSQKYGFQSDLSIIDLLFNEGPSSILWLKSLD